MDYFRLSGRSVESCRALIADGTLRPVYRRLKN
jgi:hypothetical protein